MQNQFQSNANSRRITLLLILVFLILLGLVLLLTGVILEERNGKSLLTTMIRSLSEVVLISSTVSILFESLTREATLEEFKKSSSQIINDLYKQITEFLDSTVVGTYKYGLDGLTDEAVFREFFSQMRPGDTLLWLDTYSPGYHQWLSVVEEKAKSGCKFRFLALRPGSLMAKLRAEELGDRFNRKVGESGRTVFDDELSVFIADFDSLAEKINLIAGENRIEVRIYEDLLGTPLYIIEREGQPELGLSSFYLGRATGMNFPHLEWRRTGDHAFVKLMFAYFYNKWNKCEATARSPEKKPAAVLSPSQTL